MGKKKLALYRTSSFPCIIVCFMSMLALPANSRNFETWSYNDTDSKELRITKNASSVKTNIKNNTFPNNRFNDRAKLLVAKPTNSKYTLNETCTFNCRKNSTLEALIDEVYNTDLLNFMNDAFNSTNYVNFTLTRENDFNDTSVNNSYSSMESFTITMNDSLSRIVTHEDAFDDNKSNEDINENFQVFASGFGETMDNSSITIKRSLEDESEIDIPSNIIGRQNLADDDFDNLLTSESADDRAKSISRLPRLPDIPAFESSPADENSHTNISNDELKELIAQMRQARAAGLRFEDQGTKVEECVTATGGSGTCIPLTDCKVALNNLRDTSRQQMPAICRWINDLPVVCCPRPNLPRKSEKPTCGVRIIQGLNRTVRQVPRMIPDLELKPTEGNKRGIIAGGRETELGAWPWMAGIYTRNFGMENFLCGAAIISELYLVTAAHCFGTRGGGNIQAARYAVRVGSVKVKEGTLHLVDAIIIHPEYKPREHYNDIAVIRLKDPITFNSYVSPICLPTATDIRRRKLMGSNVTVTGWGDQDFGGKRGAILREVTVQVIKLPTCDKAYEEVRGSSLPQGITLQFVCAGAPEGGKDACQRDSGGPLMLLEKGVWILVGVVSFGFQCAREGYPGVYTRVTHFLDWLTEVTSVS